jgi:hypothetical protein
MCKGKDRGRWGVGTAPTGPWIVARGQGRSPAPSGDVQREDLAQNGRRVLYIIN